MDFSDRPLKSNIQTLPDMSTGMGHTTQTGPAAAADSRLVEMQLGTSDPPEVPAILGAGLKGEQQVMVAARVDVKD